jgi:hypothetical protein
MNDSIVTFDPFSSIEMFEDAHKMADALSHSMFVPDNFKGKDALPDCIMVLGISRQLNVHPLAVMNAIYQVHGKTGFVAKFLIATVNASGKFDPIRWKFTGKKGEDSWGAIAFAKERSTGNVLEGTEVTIGMAKSEGWLGKTGSKWKTMPEQMLRYRSASFWINAYAGEYAMGMRTVEDLSDDVEQAPAATVVKRELPKAKNLNQLMDNVEQKTPFDPPGESSYEDMMRYAVGMYGEKMSEGCLMKVCNEQLSFGINSLSELKQNQINAVVDYLDNAERNGYGG